MLRETEEPGCQHARPRRQHHADWQRAVALHAIGEVHDLAAALLLNSEYPNRVVDGRTREEGSDRDLTWRGSAAWNPASGHLIEFGAQAQSLSATRIDRRFTRTTEQLLLDATGDMWSAAGWAHYRWTPTARLSITPGVRFEHWQLYDQSKASPWLLTEFEVRPGTRASLRRRPCSTSRRRSISRFYVLPGQRLVPASATTIEAGIEQRFGAAWRLNLAGLPSSRRRRAPGGGCRGADREQPRGAAGRILTGRTRLTGDTNGAEVVLERRAVSGLNGWLSYAWNDTRARRSQRAVKRFLPTTTSATPSTPMSPTGGAAAPASRRGCVMDRTFRSPDTIAQDSDGYLLSAQRNGLRLPAYSRLDLRADRTFTYRKSRLTLFIEVVNAMNRDNYRFEQSRHQHHHAAGLRAARDLIPAAAGRRDA